MIQFDHECTNTSASW